MNTVTASFNRAVRQMTEMSQQKKTDSVSSENLSYFALANVLYIFLCGIRLAKNIESFIV